MSGPQSLAGEKLPLWDTGATGYRSSGLSSQGKRPGFSLGPNPSCHQALAAVSDAGEDLLL